MLEGLNSLLDIYSGFISAFFDMPLFGSVSFGALIVGILLFDVIVIMFVRKVL